MTAVRRPAHRWQMTRRGFLGSVATLATATPLLAQSSPPVPVSRLNHMMLSVSDPGRSLEWYQGLFGMPIAARQGNTVLLRVGAGPQPYRGFDSLARISV